MLIFPAIDLKDGAVVRLYKGDFATVHQVADDPLATAGAFLAAGARHIHMVDLDGAKDGQRKNGDIVRAVAATGLRVELGGGIRSMADLEAVFDLGVWRAVIGSAAVSDPDFVREAIARYGPEKRRRGHRRQGRPCPHRRLGEGRGIGLPPVRKIHGIHRSKVYYLYRY